MPQEYSKMAKKDKISSQGIVFNINNKNKIGFLDFEKGEITSVRFRYEAFGAGVTKDHWFITANEKLFCFSKCGSCLWALEFSDGLYRDQPDEIVSSFINDCLFVKTLGDIYCISIQGNLIFKISHSDYLLSPVS